MKKSAYSLFAALVSIALVTACAESNVSKSPLDSRGRATNNNGGNPIGGTGGAYNGGTTGAGITGVQGGKLTVNGVSISGSGTNLSASYVHPSYNVRVNATAQSSSPNTDFSNEGHNNIGNKWAYVYIEGRCRSYSGSACDVAYYSIYTVDYDANGSYMVINNFGVVKYATGQVDAFPLNRTDSYVSVDELEQIYSNANP